MTDPVEEIPVSKHHIERIERRLPQTDFDSSSEYINFVLENVLYHVEQELDYEGSEVIDEEEVKDRLESLGYIDK